MGKINYENKVALNENPAIQNINKVTDSDMNEIKESVNYIYDKGLFEVTPNEPTDEYIKLWIDNGEISPTYSEVVNSLDGNETTKAPSVQAVNNALGHIVWTNSDTNIAFTPQNITLSNENYDSLLWIFKYSTGNNFSILAYSIKGMGTFANLGNGFNGDLISRQIDRVSNIEFTIHDGYLNKSINNTVLIPMYVIALKRGYNFLVGGNNI